MIRAMRRNRLKGQFGVKGLSAAWERFQRSKYGLEYFSICVLPQIPWAARATFRKAELNK